jgi:hypothetical protein
MTVTIVNHVEVVGFVDNPETGSPSCLISIHLPNEIRLVIAPVLAAKANDASKWEKSE